MKIVVLGSGTSHGVPVVGCSCPVCASKDSRDKRMRSSVYIEGSCGERALIDAGPEFRLQAIKAGISRLDGIFLTHSHADHLHGLDDVRPLSRDKPIPVYGNKETIAEMEERFSYAFRTTGTASQRGGGKPKLAPRIVNGPVQIGGLTFTPVPVKHGILDILGWEITETCSPPEINNPAKETATSGNSRDSSAPDVKPPAPNRRFGEAPAPAASAAAFPPHSSSNSLEETAGRGEKAEKNFLYLTDTSAIPPAALAELAQNSGPRVIIIGALRIRPHETHFNFEQALNTAVSLGAEKVYLTHICHDLTHKEIEEFCRNFAKNRSAASADSGGTFRLKKTEFHPARDGLEIIV